MKKMSMQILQQGEVAPDVYRLVLHGNTGALPGQFVQVGVSDSLDPFLKRPISVHNSSENTLTLLYRMAGRGTAYLAQKKAGEFLSVIGPLGKGFPLPTVKHAVVVAGGIGIAPLYYLIRTLRQAGISVSLLQGAKTASELVLQEDLRTLADEYATATDDGSVGHHGLITELLGETLQKHSCVLYSCGPMPMLEAVAKIAALQQLACYISLEARMACGVGACLGCVITCADGLYRRVCVEGPVFSAQEVFGR